MSTPKEILADMLQIDGAVGAALIDFTSAMCLGTRGGGETDMELAGAAATELIRTKRDVLARIGVEENIDEIITTLSGQYHLIRPADGHEDLFTYLILDKERSSLPLARTHLRAIDSELTLERT